MGKMGIKPQLKIIKSILKVIFWIIQILKEIF